MARRRIADEKMTGGVKNEVDIVIFNKTTRDSIFQYERPR